jgi:hypothetical protein
LKGQKDLNKGELLKTAFEHMWFKSAFNLKTMDFENVTLAKVVHIYVIEDIIYVIYNQFLVKKYLYITCNVKLGIQNANFKIISQHKNYK